MTRFLKERALILWWVNRWKLVYLFFFLVGSIKKKKKKQLRWTLKQMISLLLFPYQMYITCWLFFSIVVECTSFFRCWHETVEYSTVFCWYLQKESTNWGNNATHPIVNIFVTTQYCLMLPCCFIDDLRHLRSFRITKKWFYRKIQ